MVDDGRDHGDDRRNGDEAGSRHYEQRRSPDFWKPTNGWLAKLAAGVAALVFLITFLLKVTGWGLTGSADAIKINAVAISKLEAAATATQAATAANTQAIAGVVATTVVQSRDIADIKTALSSMMFVNCANYAKLYAGAPTLRECIRTSSSP